MHYTRPSGRVTGDSLDLVDLESRRLHILCQAWRSSDPAEAPERSEVPATWEHGSVGKLILEHSAMLLGAERDVLRVLDRVRTATDNGQLRDHTRSLAAAIDQVYEVSRGVHPVDLMVNDRFPDAVDRLLEVLDGELSGRWAGPDTEVVVSLLGKERHRLRSARHVRSHSPSHPGADGPDGRFAPLLRLKVGFDRLRGYPWAESSAFGDTRLARRIDELT